MHSYIGWTVTKSNLLTVLNFSDYQFDNSNSMLTNKCIQIYTY
ncbi:hypothetical protein rpr22_0179 [Rickettsia prowazekii str. Rp22]|uniref:Uncharacterized protein n=1 Tax=Rickettsia prowazekii (strain Rp22) TaxID=449216 RepID=D5AW97_RICPP|nr:hypothetical protein rpr22_0179 [Rickettsia prowazekii str. Rp22]